MNPAVLLIVGVIGGVGAATTYAAFEHLEGAENSLTLSDLRPAMPWEGLPLPIFFYTKPELLPKAGK
jgi:hypothetical protein